MYLRTPSTGCNFTSRSQVGPGRWCRLQLKQHCIEYWQSLQENLLSCQRSVRVRATAYTPAHLRHQQLLSTAAEVEFASSRSRIRCTRGFRRIIKISVSNRHASSCSKCLPAAGTRALPFRAVPEPCTLQCTPTYPPCPFVEPASAVTRLYLPLCVYWHS